MILLLLPMALVVIRIFFHILKNLFFHVLPTRNYIPTNENHLKTVRKSKPFFCMNCSSHERNNRTIDFCIFINGFLGNSMKPSYLFESISKAILETLPHKNNTVLHFISSNNGRTFDGVANGGKRVAKETLDVINTELNNTKCIKCRACEDMITDVTISVFGVSLGGLYGRFAISEIYSTLSMTCDKKEMKQKDDHTMTLRDGKIKVHFNTFCSLLTPHLGEHKHTYISLTRFAERLIGNRTDQSGKDIFYLNNLLWKMGTSPKFLEPLGCFCKRVAYTNAYHTDLMVSTNSGAFLHNYSQYPHYLLDTSKEICCDGLKTISFMTEKTHLSRIVNESVNENKEDVDMFQICVCLDSLGWKKVFVDSRIVSPTSLHLSTKRRESGILINDLFHDKSSDRVMTKSRDLSMNLSSQQDSICTLFPLCHPITNALSVNPVATALTWGCRPLARFIARNFVKDILSFRQNVTAGRIE